MQLFKSRDLSTVLGKANHNAPLPEQILWLENLFHAIHHAKISGQAGTHLELLRLKQMIFLLNENKNWKAEVSLVLQKILNETSCLRLFSATGLLRESGFFSEATDRVLNKILPTPIHDQDFADTFPRLFNSAHDAAWIEKMDPLLFQDILSVINQSQSESPFTSLQTSLREALIVLGTHVAELGLSRDIRERMQATGVTESPFLNLNTTLSYFVLNLGQAEPNLQTISELHDSCIAEINLCRQGVREVFGHLEDRGVSVAIVYHLENLMQSLARIEWLMQLLQISQPDSNAAPFILKFISLLVRDQQTQSTLSGLVQDNLRLISRKIVERAGASGEHYITRTRGEYFKMLLAGSGGGIITGFTTIAKFKIAHLSLPLFFEGFFHFINFASSFVFMQFCHFTLATKQSSMTGPALAMKLTNIDKAENMKSFVDEVVQIMRSQFAAIVGNVGLVVPTAFLLEHYYRKSNGASLFDIEYAHKTVASLHPFLSFTIPFAIVTGVLLWLSSIFAGWIENWFVYRRIPEAIVFNRRLNKYFGKKICGFIGKWLGANISGFGGNIGIGFLLAFLPVFGHFFGVALDVRHVTLSSGSLTLATAALYHAGQIDGSKLALAILGVIFIGFLNVFVSFLLALSIAMRARNIKLRWMWVLLKAVYVRLKASPKEFFIVQKKQALL
ncbi:MAG: hypothetical protein SGJ18_15310 [Pseudomonadota bacterium]|nr:hypothetical protein [Pseudomonadota bacterium]